MRQIKLTVLLLSLFLCSACNLSAAIAKTVSYQSYDQILSRVIKRDKMGLNRVNYGLLKRRHLAALNNHIQNMKQVKVSKLSRKGQFAYWANLYNAITLKVVAEHYPVKSIKDIDISPGWFANGPWKKKLITIEGRSLSLDDIEHGILRKRFKSPLVHYAVNCASIGCPNLLKTSFKGGTLDQQLAKAAADYVNSPRGVNMTGSRLVLSKIYSWFQSDFGGSKAKLLKHLSLYARPKLKKRLNANPSVSYSYDWRLNDLR